MKYFSHLNTTVKILGSYKGEMPFHNHLRDFCSREKKYGSKDRKQISSLCYSYFRLGKAAQNMPVEERIVTAYFLCLDKADEFITNLRPDWVGAAPMDLKQKFAFLKLPFAITDVFPWKEIVSEQIDYPKFCESHFIQPDLFLRIRPGNEKAVINKLQSESLSFRQVSANSIALPNGTKLEQVLKLNKEAVVQDISSQRVGELLSLVKPEVKSEKNFSVWDCCAASGGKSILAKDILGDIDLKVSDIRDSILINLKKRFEEARIDKYKSFTIDLTKPATELKSIASTTYDLVIADVPCTGSGTWGRTPEQLYFFELEKIEEYASKQEVILDNIISAVKPGGYLLYCTCSVFKNENEQQVHRLTGKFPFEVIEVKTLEGYENKADSLFVALLKKGPGAN